MERVLKELEKEILLCSIRAETRFSTREICWNNIWEKKKKEEGTNVNVVYYVEHVIKQKNHRNRNSFLNRIKYNLPESCNSILRQTIVWWYRFARLAFLNWKLKHTKHIAASTVYLYYKFHWNRNWFKYDLVHLSFRNSILAQRILPIHDTVPDLINEDLNKKI